MNKLSNQNHLSGKNDKSSEMKTIIAFDGWTEGASNFLRLYPDFLKKGYKLVLIHVGSWGHDTGRPKEELFGEMLVRDISFYSGKTFSKILDEEDPSCIVFLSTRAIAHRAFNRWAKFKRIPTCHLYHGLVRSVAKSDLYAGTNYLQHFKVLHARTIINVTKIIPIYLEALFKTRAGLDVWREFLISVLEKFLSKKLSSDNYIADTNTSIGCVYLESEKSHMIENYKIPADSVHVVGNPDLMKFGLKPADMGCRCTADVGSGVIIYIDTALSKSGFVYSSDDDFVNHLISTNQSLKEQGFVLLVKLHPAHYQSNVPERIKSVGIDLCEDRDFLPALKNATAAIVEPSSVALIPALIGLPLLLAQYQKLTEAPYGDMIVSYPRACYVRDINKVAKILRDERDGVKSEYVMSWISENSGPLPAEEMPKRVVHAIEQLINSDYKCA